MAAVLPRCFAAHARAPALTAASISAHRVRRGPQLIAHSRQQWPSPWSPAAARAHAFSTSIALSVRRSDVRHADDSQFYEVSNEQHLPASFFDDDDLPLTSETSAPRPAFVSGFSHAGHISSVTDSADLASDVDADPVAFDDFLSSPVPPPDPNDAALVHDDDAPIPTPDEDMYPLAGAEHAPDEHPPHVPYTQQMKDFVRPMDFRAQLFQTLRDPTSFWGHPLPADFPTLAKSLKGLRLGEMTVFTGPTGAGKTTFLTQYSLALMQTGVRTLWGSFELPNHVLQRKMVCQLRKKRFHDFTEAELGESLEVLQRLPLWMLPFYGTTSISNILDSMARAVEEHGVQHILLDNLQFFLSAQGDRFVDKLQIQENAVHEIRQFASSKNVHVTVVAHPRKELGTSKLTIDSIAGTAKTAQEADNVLLLQRTDRGDMTLEIHKNRFDGSIARIPLAFSEDGAVRDGVVKSVKGAVAIEDKREQQHD
ncbi:hypothetical protein GGF31_006604 [Allomyces arbusculus]|nr:hypothetical protein GGF31_006604 [Allomyces arbusculus]